MTTFEWLVLGIVAVNGMAWVIWVVWESKSAWLDSEIMRMGLDVKHKLWQLQLWQRRNSPDDIQETMERLKRENRAQRDRITILEAACEMQLKEWRKQ